LIQPSHLPIFTVWMATDESGRIVSYFEDPPLSWSRCSCRPGTEMVASRIWASSPGTRARER
jgi:hypothetical protein